MNSAAFARMTRKPNDPIPTDIAINPAVLIKSEDRDLKRILVLQETEYATLLRKFIDGLDSIFLNPRAFKCGPMTAEEWETKLERLHSSTSTREA